MPDNVECFYRALLRFVDWTRKSERGQQGELIDMKNCGAIVYRGQWHYTWEDGCDDICGEDFKSSN